MSNGWGHLKNTPFRWYKSSAQEGGVSVPFILRWSGRWTDQAGSIRTQRLHVTDVYPSLMSLAGQTYPNHDNGRPLEPLYGHSFWPLISDPSLPHRGIHDEIFWGFNQTGKGLVRGDWKSSSLSDGPWQLYNIVEDPAESTDLAAAEPGIAAELSDAWFRFAEDRTAMPASWRAPLREHQEGWGFHRIRMVMPGYVRAEPPMAAMNVSRETDLTFYFSRPIGFANSTGRTLRLYEAGHPEIPVWQADPQPGHAAEGKRHLTFDDLPTLKPNTTYFALSDPGWITLGGQRARGLNDGAYWYRFRTGTD